MSTLIDFQLGQTTDLQGRTIEEIWALSDFWLEHDHKYMQWLFPIDTQTTFNRHAPVLSQDDAVAFERFRRVEKCAATVAYDDAALFWYAVAGNEYCAHDGVKHSRTYMA